MPGTASCIIDIENRRVLTADEQNGLVVGFSMFWHQGGARTVKIKGVPGVE